MRFTGKNYDRKNKEKSDIDEDEDDKMITVNMRVDYGIKGDIINDMLTSLPYTGLKQDGSLTIVHFDRENFNFSPELTKNITLGNYRSVPLIRFFDNDGIVIYPAALAFCWYADV